MKLPVVGKRTVIKKGELFQYCWEFHSHNGKMQDGCLECGIYHTRSRRCYESSALSSDAGQCHTFCKGACEKCDYYLKVKGQRPNILTVSKDSRLKTSIRKSVAQAGFNFKATDCEYRCAMLLDRFRPDYAIVDSALGIEKSHDFIELLYADPRLPFVKIALVVDRQEIPKRCDKMIFAFIERHFTNQHLHQLLGSFVAN
jgi:hypothetical protein